MSNVLALLAEDTGACARLKESQCSGMLSRQRRCPRGAGMTQILSNTSSTVTPDFVTRRSYVKRKRCDALVQLGKCALGM